MSPDSSGMFRAVNWAMAALFCVAALLQYNDPDPLLWISIYGAATLVTAFAATRGSAPVVVSLLVAAVALTWGLVWSRDVPGLVSYAQMFDRWRMTNAAVEEARETSGLLIVTLWMIVIAWQSRRRRGWFLKTGRIGQN